MLLLSIGSTSRPGQAHCPGAPASGATGRTGSPAVGLQPEGIGVSAFAGLVRRVFTAASLPLEVLAERCRVSPATIAAFEQARRPAPRLPAVALIADSLGGPVAKLDEAPCN